MGNSKKYIIWIAVIAAFIIGYFIMDGLLFNGLKPRIINENGFQANYYVKENTENKETIILIGGGQWGDYWGQQFAEKGYVGLSLPYTRREGLPSLPEEIDMEYFENALKWLEKQPEVNKDKIVIMGASRNAELSLVIASNLNEYVDGVIAYAPSSVSWSNTVLPFNSNEIKASWKYKGADIPYIPMNKVTGNESNKIETLEYWESGLAKMNDYPDAIIKVENISGPILLLSGIDDKVWPSAMMADMIEKRLIDHNFKYPFQNIQYEKFKKDLFSFNNRINSAEHY